jgi:hypothetical protein
MQNNHYIREVGQLHKYLATLIWPGLFWISNTAMGQVDSNRLFLRSKGHWKAPLSHYTREMTNDSKKYSLCQRHFEGVAFIADDSLPVKAVFEGKIFSVFRLEDEYAIMTKFGDYFVIYSGLNSVVFQKGDNIRSGKS